MNVRTKNTHQDKGLVLVLQDLHASAPVQLQAKSSYEAAHDYCWSALVLSAAFGFRVSPGHQYYLYWVESRWKLSLISPEEWGRRQPGAFVARCELRHDMTWALAFDKTVTEDSEAHGALLRYLEGIRSQLESLGSWSALLRQGERHLPYQQRVLTTALSSSLRQSLMLSGQTGVPLSVPLLTESLRVPNDPS